MLTWHVPPTTFETQNVTKTNLGTAATAAGCCSTNTRIQRCVSHPLGRFSTVDISTVGIVPPVPTRSASEISLRELSEDVSFGVGALLVVEQSSLENRPREV